MTSAVAPQARAVRFRVDGAPMGQPRPRACRVGNGVRLHDTSAAVAEKSRVGMAALVARRTAGLSAPFDCPVRVRILAVFALPTSKFRKRAAPVRTLRGTKPDSDNVAKLYLDALNCVLFVDDGRVASLTVEKWNGAPGEAPFVEVTVEELWVGTSAPMKTCARTASVDNRGQSNGVM